MEELASDCSLLTSDFRLQTLFITLIVVALTFAACSKTIDETIDDATITAAVKTALLNDPEVGAMKIDVDTASGVVTLSGSVKSQLDAEKATALARRAPGVKDVKSALQVNAPTRPASYGGQARPTRLRSRASCPARATAGKRDPLDPMGRRPNPTGRKARPNRPKARPTERPAGLVGQVWSPPTPQS